MFVLIYFGQSLVNAFYILALGLLPWIFTALLFQLVSNALRNACARIMGLKVYMYVTAPGVVVHELSHAFFCIVFRHKIMKMVLFSPEDDGTLGYVNHAYNTNSFYQRAGNFFIGTGPVWGGIFILFIISKFLLPAEMLTFTWNFPDNIFVFFDRFFSSEQWTSYKFYLWLYFALTIGSHITLSKSDLVSAKDGLLLICISAVVCCICFGWCGNWEQYFISLLKSFFAGQIASICSIFSLLFIIAVILKLIPLKK